MVTSCPEVLWQGSESLCFSSEVQAESFSKLCAFSLGFCLTESVLGCFLVLIISLRDCGKWDDVFIMPTSVIFYFIFKIFFFCFFCLCFITSVFHPYANTVGLTKWPMSAVEDRGRLGVAVERVFHFDVIQWGRRREREECFQQLF